MEDRSVGVIWFDPRTNRYEFGSWQVFQSTRQVSNDLEIIYEIKNLTAKLAQKIVKELNAARFENENSSNRAA